MNKPLALNMLLDLLKFDIYEKLLKKVNIKVLWLYSFRIIFLEAKDKNANKMFFFLLTQYSSQFFYLTIINIWKQIWNLFFFYNYIKIIFSMEFSTKKSNILFDKYYHNILSKVQQSSNIVKCKTFVAFVEPFFINKNTKDVIRKGYPKVDKRHNDVAFILFTLFIF